MSKEALKLALEALEFNDRRFSIDNYPRAGTVRSVGERAIAAIKQALEQPVQEPVCHICKGTGEMDHGGTYPWGEAINIPCKCTAPPAAPVHQTCNCRWDGEVQVQQCTLHQAHVDAIHEWAERAKAAEAKLVAQPAPDLQAELDATNRQVEILSDALAEARRDVAALKAVQPVAWQHIESAPKDGTRILCQDEKGLVDICEWTEDRFTSSDDRTFGGHLAYTSWTPLPHSGPALPTPPAAQPAVPMTDEQIDAAVKAWFQNENVAGLQPFAKRMRAAIEAAHGIKENT